jgi:alpha-L-fucosidase 2
LWDGNHAWKILKRLFRPTGVKGFDMEDGGGTYPNLFDAHPPFQIDGNFGATAGIAEMLVQSHEGEVRLLPALPDAWASKGSVRGLKATGGVTVDVTWRNGMITSYKLTGPNADRMKVKFGRPQA